jgi:Ca2+-binding RTX toxin-like protein
LNASAASAGINRVDISGTTTVTGNSIDVSAFGSLNGVTLIGPTTAAKAADLTGGAGADTITAASGGGTIIGGAGSDTITASGGVDTIVINATVGVKSDSNSTTTDTLTTTSFNFSNDIFKIVATSVHAFDASTDVSVLTTSGRVDLSGDSDVTGAGDVVLTFGSSTGLSTGFAGRLQYDLTDTTGADTITGGALNDTITYTGGADDLDGGAGTADTLVIKQSESGKVIQNSGLAALYSGGPTTAMAFIDLSETSAQTLSTGNTIAIANIENLDASGQLNPTIGIGVWGTDASNSIIGGAGADFVRGFSGEGTTGGNDTIVGNDGADFLRGAKGGDLIFAGSQTTTTASVYAEGAESTLTDAGVPPVLKNSLSTFGTFHSTVFKDANVLEGRTGNDTIVASTGKDVMFFQVGDYGDANGTTIGTDVIHGFTIGEDWILVTNLTDPAGDHTFFGSTAAITALGTAPTGQNPLLGSTNGWSVSAVDTTAHTATLTYAGTSGVGVTPADSGFSITFVGLQNDSGLTANAASANSFFFH